MEKEMQKNSSVFKRILSGSSASWTNILLNIVVQLALVPLFLHYWGAATYGLWLLFLSVWGVYLIFYNSFQLYVGFDAIKIARDKTYLNKVMSSTAGIAILLAIMLIIITYVFRHYNFGSFLGLNIEMENMLYVMLFIYSFAWLLSGALHVTFEKWLIPFGYAPYVLWLNTIRMFARNSVAVISIISGNDIIQTVVFTGLIDVFVYWVSFFFVTKFLKKNELYWTSNFCMRLGFTYLKNSFFLFVKYILDACRNIGLRLLLAPALSVSEIALFATLRTPSNIVMQGANSIAYSMQPELMSSIRDNELSKVFIFNTLLWFILAILIIPFVYVLQLIMPAFYEFWTLGKFDFDGEIFALFSIVVITYTLYLPLESIVKGNNLVKQQAAISLTSVVLMLLNISLFATQYGVLGVAYSLLIVEILVLFIYSVIAFKWLKKNSFNSPFLSFSIILACLTITGIILYLMSVDNSNKFIYFFVGIFTSVFCGLLLWFSYPKEIKNQTINIVKRKFNK